MNLDETSAAEEPNAHIANIVLNHFGAAGYTPSASTALLMRTWEALDRPGRARLALGWPGLCQAMNAAANDPLGLPRLRTVAAGEKTWFEALAIAPTGRTETDVQS